MLVWSHPCILHARHPHHKQCPSHGGKSKINSQNKNKFHSRGLLSSRYFQLNSFWSKTAPCTMLRYDSGLNSNKDKSESAIKFAEGQFLTIRNSIEKWWECYFYFYTVHSYSKYVHGLWVSPHFWPLCRLPAEQFRIKSDLDTTQMVSTRSTSGVESGVTIMKRVSTEWY